MDKNSIKKFAVWARRELITRVSQRAVQYEITEKGYGEYDADSVNGRVMSASEKSQRKALIDQIRAKGYEQVMEEVAYTWFNRFSALRFMEVNGYLPSRIRVFTDDNNNFKPQIITDDDDKIRLNQRKPSKYKGLRRFGPEKNLQRINKFMKERPIFYKNLIQMKENIRFYLRCFYCITKVMILQFNSENRTELARNG